MLSKGISGWCFVTLIISSLVMTTFALPQQQIALRRQQQSAERLERDNRKFAEKPNALKKVALDDLDDDIQTNQIGDSPNGFSWSNVMGSVLQMIFQGGLMAGPNKSDDVDPAPAFQQSPWANIISVGLKLFTTLLGGGAQNGDGIDKVDNGASSPMQNILAAVISTVLGARDPDQVNTMAKQAGEFINIVVNLLDALKTSFSHRSLAARSIGKKDSVSDATVAGLLMAKSYIKTYRNASDKCMQKYLCEANSECTHDVGGSSIFCQLGSYATSFLLERTTDSTFEGFYEAGRRGRSGVDCRQIYLECNEV